MRLPLTTKHSELHRTHFALYAPECFGFLLCIFGTYFGILGILINGAINTMSTESTSCTGSTLLQPLSDVVALPLDQVNCCFIKYGVRVCL